MATYRSEQSYFIFRPEDNNDAFRSVWICSVYYGSDMFGRYSKRLRNFWFEKYRRTHENCLFITYIQKSKKILYISIFTLITRIVTTDGI